MQFWDWLKQFFGGSPTARRSAPVRRFSAPGVCPFCGVRLKSPAANECQSCGLNWEDPGMIVQVVSPAAIWAEVVSPPHVPGNLPPVVASRVTPSIAAPSPPPPKENLDGLDLGRFAPISRAETMLRAGFTGLWGNPWFGRRDLIPPANDGRTNLIDRGMVGQGLITPEELADIHRVGDEMEQARGHLAMANNVADFWAERAVEQSKEERAKLKAKKQAAAVERELRRAADVAERRRTDIIFLGRGVSRGLADRRANVEQLQALGLPVLATPADVATALGLSIPRLRWLAFHAEAATRVHYISFEVTKKSGGKRRLSAPHKDLRRCQDWIYANILRQVPMHNAAHGFVPGRSTATNAAAHVGQDVVVNVDLTDFFPTITFGRVKGAFRGLGYSPAAATILALLCTEAPRRKAIYDGRTYFVAVGERGLPQGAATSPALSNLVSRRLDARLAGLAAKLGWSYTRYADDLTLSASGPPAAQVGYVLARLRHIAADEGFAVNEKKTRVQRQNARQSVTGVVVNERLGAPRDLVRRLRSILHRAQREGLARQNRENLPHFESWLAGMIAYVSMLNSVQGRRLRGDFEALMPH